MQTENADTGKDVKEGTLRLLTLGEIAMARTIFGGAINYPRVWIHCASYLPFGLQYRNTAMTPNGEIYFRKEMYSRDFSDTKTELRYRHLFMHEMMHVWQHQHRMWVRMRGLFSWAADYSYELDGRHLLRYSLEQQAQIMADYYVLVTFGYSTWEVNRKKNYPLISFRGNGTPHEILAKYKKAIFSSPHKG